MWARLRKKVPMGRKTGSILTETKDDYQRDFESRINLNKQYRIIK